MRSFLQQRQTPEPQRVEANEQQRNDDVQQLREMERQRSQVRLQQRHEWIRAAVRARRAPVTACETSQQRRARLQQRIETMRAAVHARRETIREAELQRQSQTEVPQGQESIRDAAGVHGEAVGARRDHLRRAMVEVRIRVIRLHEVTCLSGVFSGKSLSRTSRGAYCRSY